MERSLETTRRLLEHARGLRRRRAALGEPRAVDVVDRYERQLTTGARVADAFASTVGSWRFIIIQSVILACWIVLNVIGWIRAWDPYPFILLNLALSFQAAYAAPIIMMSQNRAADLDRIQAVADFKVNQKAELEIEELLTILEAHTHLLEELRDRLTPSSAGPAAD